MGLAAGTDPLSMASSSSWRAAEVVLSPAALLIVGTYFHEIHAKVLVHSYNMRR